MAHRPLEPRLRGEQAAEGTDDRPIHQLAVQEQVPSPSVIHEPRVPHTSPRGGFLGAPHHERQVREAFRRFAVLHAHETRDLPTRHSRRAQDSGPTRTHRRSRSLARSRLVPFPIPCYFKFSAVL